jgi:seryl-tRNA synthetase
MLDIELFRNEETIKVVKKSEERRFKTERNSVERVITADLVWRKTLKKKEDLNKNMNLVKIVQKDKFKNKEDPGTESNLDKEYDLYNLDIEEIKGLKINQIKTLQTLIKEEGTKIALEEKERAEERNVILLEIGNLVHDTSVVSKDEENNGVERTWGKEREQDGTLLNHVEIMTKLGQMDTEKGSKIAGSRCYYLKGDLVLLNLAITNYAINFLVKKSYTPIYPPFFINKTIMSEVAQLSQFDDELYKVVVSDKKSTGEEKKEEKKSTEEEKNEEEKKKTEDEKNEERDKEEKYLIATSEQPIAAYHRGENLDDKSLPIRYCGYSTCFRKEVGTHGKDTLGIFRVHQFDKIEQFCITSPKDDISWKMMDEMITNSEEFYRSLGLCYKVINIVSGALNNAAAKKLDLEAYFPASKTYRELVSCSNCTDYQSRRLNIRYGFNEKKKGSNENYVHMLNSTLCATTRTMCCIVENYQTKDGIEIPEVLQSYMGGVKFIPFPKKDEKKDEKKKKEKIEEKKN